ncbi:MAG: DUF177 domain-containing protein [Deltaproteobacteria bacterium]|nr:DUF177 domain-containing protein [Deltaproteobacteria bacterium]
MNLKIRVTDIPVTGMELFYNLTVREVEVRLTALGGERVRLAAPVMTRFKLERTGDRVLIQAKVSTVLRLVCSLCLDEFDMPMSEDVFLALTPFSNEQAEKEVTAGELNEEYYDGEEVDLWPMIQGQLFLALPIRPVCREGCQGLCLICGQNLNVKSCGCSSPAGHPGFMKLAQLKENLSKK